MTEEPGETQVTNDAEEEEDLKVAEVILDKEDDRKTKSDKSSRSSSKYSEPSNQQKLPGAGEALLGKIGLGLVKKVKNDQMS